MGNTDRREGSLGSVTMLVNLYCEIHEIYTLYIDRLKFLKNCSCFENTLCQSIHQVFNVINNLLRYRYVDINEL